MSDTVVAALIGAAGIIVGTAIAGGMTWLQARREARERERTRREQNLLAAFQYFTGRTQARSVGLSIIEASWRDTPQSLPMFIPLLVNQAIYLVTQSKEKEDAALEYRNLDRIFALLGESGARPRAAGGDRELSDILRKRAGGKFERGLKLDAPRVNRYLKLLGEAGDVRENVPEHTERDADNQTAASAVNDEERGEHGDDT